MARNIVKFNPSEHLIVTVKMPRAWSARLWLAAQVMRVGGWIAGIGVEIELADKQ